MLPCETEDFRKDDDRIFDWMESEACRVWPARGVSSLVASGSSSGLRDVGASGMGSVGDSSCVSGCVDWGSSSFSPVAGSSGVAASASGGGGGGVLEDSGVSDSFGVSELAGFLLAFFFCFWSCATCFTGIIVSNHISHCNLEGGGEQLTLFLAAASFSAFRRSSSSAMACLEILRLCDEEGAERREKLGWVRFDGRDSRWVKDSFPHVVHGPPGRGRLRLERHHSTV
ncbi:hypothetical protein P175DRAFT_0258479 [Aspergillus ochraceoroseus IBT 24754]|uniref:Uncharacterized protein n=1 Tax=Aspergillus ochraceoroseus IBT 24754 TaxID=1392256 RepID=A0A2T5LUA4_9EURO|nr:uncharacterized protein P175DRAFT_0258479 [Aspergillus ochraceoroseus IBT 24754]PTU19865.1 hypothetical protein P175DRAFT_0258479 [Aspergillus ochraceoroseus IBT 24754]